MALTTRQIQARIDLVYKRFRAQHSFNENVMIKDFCDKLIDELIQLEKRDSKYQSEEDKHIKDQEILNKALKMNNPLYDIWR